MGTYSRSDIPVGRQNAILKADLCSLWHVDERTVRAIVARMRQESGDRYAILSSSTSPAGFWRSDDIDEIERFISETTSRARNTLAALEDAKRVLREAEGRRDYGDGIVGRQL